ncbi:MAG: phage shock protein PspA [Desulfobacterales bacterium]|nr:phage shock protein PspA [Desulfobacterales bacterium]MDJ0855509.1 phage shock protein PspA [Desulfobacterales bacterium]MDJ0885717.1 phage shock protein PspA [Desulfobacterales bacterium]MDJ0990806.1 phage shock protein PspA [Desulfobacterales bacterium]
MGIFTRFRDIVSSNINAMLDRAEDPEKMIKLMIREMEDTLVEIKAACAGAMAEKKKVLRRLEEIRERAELWEERARLAVAKQRDDLAREALVEKRRLATMVEKLDADVIEHGGLINQYQDDIQQLEDKLHKAREKQRMLVQRHIHATSARKAREEIRRADNYASIAKFDELEQRIERMEAEADLVNFGRQPNLDDAFDALRSDDDIERELAAIKASQTRSAEPGADRQTPRKIEP